MKTASIREVASGTHLCRKPRLVNAYIIGRTLC
jgi:hypothetical protein